MTADERARIPPPGRCTGCSWRRTYRRACGGEMVSRSECTHPQTPPMHPLCGYFAPATPPVGGYTPDAL